ncbi:MAG: HAD family hydrolase [Gemmatimonadetes bacterium]|nr:HAD family hydrolase [Gemmatimonadota bacterium]MBT4612741.1 HAD family hydrolase [Gemmatimonadota bacterium]MBT5055017.1 HAD family hydrolase [Gemmatimonadota bacterium]MBT5143354.1 HAD family hydrolase [Gemmatimonadota bacterium]MBT5586712.1 HAD family hydrolase [Gemmatimonadota bacterium]
MNLDAEDVWHIGDNVRTDVGGANAAGLHSVWLNRFEQTLTEDDPVPDIEVKSLSELASLLGPGSQQLS